MELAIGTEVVTEYGLGTIKDTYLDKHYVIELEDKSLEGWIYHPEINPTISKHKLHVIVRTEEEHADAVKQLLKLIDTHDDVLINTLADAIELYEKDIGRVN